MLVCCYSFLLMFPNSHDLSIYLSIDSSTRRFMLMFPLLIKDHALSIRPTLELVSNHWGSLSDRRCGAYGLSRALRRHPYLNWTELVIDWFDVGLFFYDILIHLSICTLWKRDRQREVTALDPLTSHEQHAPNRDLNRLWISSPGVQVIQDLKNIYMSSPCA